MYFESRVAAGRQLADAVAPDFAGQPCAVVALSDGGVMVAAQIAMRLQAPLMMLLSEEIILPRELTAVGGITQSGAFTYNGAFSSSEIDELLMEYRGVIEEEKLAKLHHINREFGSTPLIRRDLLEHRNVILVVDGLSSGFLLDLASIFLKPIAVRSTVVAVPFASVPAVDRMHVMADKIYCLNVIEDYISTDHYYDTQDVPSHEMAVKTIEQIIGHWK